MALLLSWGRLSQATPALRATRASHDQSVSRIFGEASEFLQNFVSGARTTESRPESRLGASARGACHLTSWLHSAICAWRSFWLWIDAGIQGALSATLLLCVGSPATWAWAVSCSRTSAG